MLLAYDLSYYIYHYLQHKVPLMWELHKVHHSAEVMVGVTQGRVHPLDDFMTHLWDGILPGLAYGAWLFFALTPVELTIFGINVYVLRNILMMDFVRHTHFKLSFGKWLNAIILCPHYHQLHHRTQSKAFRQEFRAHAIDMGSLCSARWRCRNPTRTLTLVCPAASIRNINP